MPPPDCPFCGHANPTAAKFCNECGSPLHLTPCGDCGAVNNLAEAHCWRCGKVLSQRRRELPTQEVLEQELVALEQEVQDLSPAPTAAAMGARSAPGPTSSAGAGPPAREPPRAERRAAIPELDEVVAVPRRRPSRAMASAAVVGVVALAIGVGAYLHSLGRPAGIRGPASPPAPVAAAARPVPGLPVPEAPQAPPAPATDPLPHADQVAASPHAPRQGATPPEARVVREVEEAAALAPADAEPGPKAVDGPIESRSEGETGEAPAAPVAAAAHGSGCPPAVAAMALCDWVGDGKR
jgi:hypothetical protein